jgi:hypothetical protein
VADTQIERDSLRDLDGVRVVVESPGGVLDKDQLQKVVESKLRAAGIKVQNPGDFPVGDPFLRLRVTTTAETNGIAGYNVELEFLQIVFLRRNPAQTFNSAQTWKAKGQLGLAAGAQLAAKIQQELSAQMDQFIAAYRSGNPK